MLYIPTYIHNYIYLYFQKQKSSPDLLRLTVQQASISISEPLDSPISSTEPALPNQQSISTNPSPPPISISPGSPPAISPQHEKICKNEEKENLLVKKNSQPTIIEESHDHNDIAIASKASLNLPGEQALTVQTTLSATNQNNLSGNGSKPSLPERSQSDRRKLSVTNLIGFGERRRSTSSIFSDMRKMSVTNFDNLKSPGIGKK